MEGQLEEYRIRVVDLEDVLEGTQADRDGHVEMMHFHSKESGLFRQSVTRLEGTVEEHD